MTPDGDSDTSLNATSIPADPNAFIAKYCRTCIKALSPLIDELRRFTQNGSTGFIPPPKIPHHQFPDGLLTASAWGCGICARLVIQYQAARLPMVYPSAGRSEHSFIECNYGFVIGKGFIFFIIGTFQTSFELEQFSKSALTLSNYRNVLEQHTGSPAVLERGKNWLTTCMNEHPRCNPSKNLQYYPPRLVSIDSGIARVIDTSIEQPTTPYTALSYCWGRDPTHMTLTERNNDVLKLGLPFAKFGKAFEEVFVVLPSLGFTLIWVDALCIMQAGADSEKDWQRHLTEMSVIYSNCVVNITIDHAESVADGCFTVRDPMQVKPCIIDRSLWPPCDGGVSQLGSDDIWVIESQTVMADEMSGAAIFQRGWAMQERMLSPRILHFGKTQLHWECTELQACETHPYGLLERMYYPSPWSCEFLPSMVLGGWAAAVKQFSSMRLSKPEDKLPAIAGIAKTICETHKQQYVAGFLKASLPAALCWHSGRSHRSHEGRNVFSRHEDRLVSRHQPYRAPSWSWAAWDGPLFFSHLELGEDLCTISHMECTLKVPTNPYGQISHATLTLDAIVLIPEDVRDNSEVSASASTFTVSSHTANQPIRKCHPSSFALYYDQSRFQIDRSGSVLIGISSSSVPYPDQPERRWTMEGIILTPLRPRTGGGSDRWIRIGMFEIHGLAEEDVSVFKLGTVSSFTLV